MSKAQWRNWLTHHPYRWRWGYPTERGFEPCFRSINFFSFFTIFSQVFGCWIFGRKSSYGTNSYGINSCGTNSTLNYGTISYSQNSYGTNSTQNYGTISYGQNSFGKKEYGTKFHGQNYYGHNSASHFIRVYGFLEFMTFWLFDFSSLFSFLRV